MKRLVLLLILLLALPVLAQDDVTPLDPDTLTARELIRLPLLSAPARTSAHLAPDGERLMHVRGTTFCLYALIGVQIGCSDMVEQGVTDNRGLNIEADSISWSPDGEYMAFTTDVWRLLRDSDIWVLDVNSGRFHNMTDDGYDGRVGFGDGIPERATIDTTPTWMPDGRLSFARHAPTADGVPPSLWTISPTGGMPEKMSDFETVPDHFSIIYGMEWSPDGSTLAYIVDSRDNPFAGVWLYDPLEDHHRPLRYIPEGVQGYLRVSYSPDGQNLLLLDYRRDTYRASGSRPTEETGYTVVNIESGEVHELLSALAVTSAGWLPAGGLVYSSPTIAGDTGGLFVTADVSAPGRKVLDFPEVDGSPFPFFAPTSLQVAPLFVSPNGRLLLATAGELTLSVELSSE